MRYIKVIFLFLLTPLGNINADNIQFTASSPKVVEVGEQFEVVYTISAQPSGFKPPEFKNFNLLGGPSTSSSSNVQIINGKITQSSSYSYTYYFSADNPGKFNIEPAKATVNGKAYTSNALTIEVVGTSKTGSTQKGNTNAGANTNAEKEDNSVDVGNEDVFVRLLVDRNTVYQGEGIIATIKLFSKLSVSNLSGPEGLALTDFFTQDINIPQIHLERENVKGQIYLTAIVQKFILFPQKSGDLTISSFSMPVVVQVQARNRPRGFFDDFFGPQVQEVQKKLKSLPVKIYVKALPANNPASFKGAVGNFNFIASIDKNNVKTNDAITLKLAISGNGNLKTIEPLVIKFPPDFETYDPKININTTASIAGLSGSKTFEYLVIPRHSGNFKISPIEFTYFNPQTKSYKTLSSGEFEINVEKGATEGTTVVTGVSKEDVKFLGKDIQFIKTYVPVFRVKDDLIFGSLRFWLCYIISFLLFIILILIWRKRIRDNTNIILMRNKRANKIAHKRLKDANLYLKNEKKEEFYEYILKALWGYMSDKLSIPLAELSQEKIIEATGKRNIKPEVVNRFIEILNTCEYARYAPVEDNSQMDIVYADSISVISQIEQNIK